MLHIVPILCLIFFVFFVEYRLKRHIDRSDELIYKLHERIQKLNVEITQLKQK